MATPRENETTITHQLSRNEDLKHCFSFLAVYITVGGDCNFSMEFTSLTVGGFTQPSTATNIMTVPGNAEKGLSQRFLWICPEPKFLEYDTLGKVDETFYNKIGKWNK